MIRSTDDLINLINNININNYNLNTDIILNILFKILKTKYNYKSPEHAIACFFQNLHWRIIDQKRKLIRENNFKENYKQELITTNHNFDNTIYNNIFARDELNLFLKISHTIFKSALPGQMFIKQFTLKEISLVTNISISTLSRKFKLAIRQFQKLQDCTRKDSRRGSIL